MAAVAGRCPMGRPASASFVPPPTPDIPQRGDRRALLCSPADEYLAAHAVTKRNARRGPRAVQFGLIRRGGKESETPLEGRREEACRGRGAMPRHSESVEIGRPAEEVWRLLGEPERWAEGYVETRSRSPDYPGPNSRNNHVFRTQMKV